MALCLRIVELLPRLAGERTEIGVREVLPLKGQVQIAKPVSAIAWFDDDRGFYEGGGRHCALLRRFDHFTEQPVLRLTLENGEQRRGVDRHARPAAVVPSPCLRQSSSRRPVMGAQRLEEIVRTYRARLVLQFGSTVFGKIHGRSGIDIAALLEKPALRGTPRSSWLLPCAQR